MDTKDILGEGKLEHMSNFLDHYMYAQQAIELESYNGPFVLIVELHADQLYGY